MTGQERMTRWWGAIWRYWTLDGPKASRASRHSFHGSSSPTSHSYFRHGKMPHLPKHSSLAHITWGCSSQGQESQGVPSRVSGTVSTSSLALLWAGECSGPPCHDPFSSPSPPLPMPSPPSFRCSFILLINSIYWASTVSGIVLGKTLERKQWTQQRL